MKVALIRTRLLTGIGVAALASGSALAQSSPPTGDQQERVAASASGVEDIVVTAQRREENLQRTPIAITALTASSLEASGITDLTGVIQATPSLYFAPYPSSSTTLVVFMRGQGIGDPNVITWDGGVGLYVDSIYQSRPQASTFDLADVERVEVLRGPQGTLYGRNTTGGAVNIISKKPTGELGVDGLLSVGNLGHRRALVNLNLDSIGTLKVKLTGLYSNRDGWARNAANTGNIPDANDFQSDRKLAVRGAVRWEPSDDVTLDYAVDYSEQRTTPIRYITENAFAPILNPGYNSNVNEAYRPVYLPFSNVKSYGHTLIAEYRPSESIALRSLSSYRRIDVNTYQDYVEAFLVPFWAFDDVQSKTYTQEFQAVGDFGDSVRYVFGLYYFNEKASHLLAADIGTGSPGQQVQVDRFTTARSISKAAYGQVTFIPGFADGKLDLTLGARYTKDDRDADRVRSSTFFIGQTSPLVNRSFNGPGFRIPLGTVIGATQVSNDKFNPSITAAYRPNENLMIYGKVVTGYKAGGANEASPNFNRTFGPETVTSYEVGVKSDLLDRRLRLNLAGFISRYRDLQLGISADAQDASLADTFNAGNALVKGLEIDATAVPVDGLTFRVDYAYTTSSISGVLAPEGSIFDPVINPGSPTQVGDDISGFFVLPFTPRHSIRLSTDWEIGMVGPGMLVAHAGYTWKDEIFTTAGAGPSVPFGRDAPVNPDFALVDARLAWRVERGEGQSISVALWGKNIFDARYPAFVIGSGSIIDGYSNQAISFGDRATYGINIGFTF